MPDDSDANAQQSAQSPVSLDALFSPGPQNESFQSSQLLARASIVTESEFNEVALDDETTPSNVELESKLPTEHPSPSLPSVQENTEVSEEDAPTHPTHKKSASMTTIRSSHNLPFIMARLDIQNGEETGVARNRSSIEATQHLQEEFARLKEEEVVAEENAANGVSTSIDWDFWGAVISSYQEVASEQPEKLAQAIAKGIPGTLRGMMWQLMAASKDADLESQYLKLLKESSSHEKAIMRDLGRTFPHHAFFTDGQGIGQENLFNVLKAYSIFDPQVGYCQGLPFVVAILLLNMPDEEAFSLLVRLMHVYDLRGHFLPEMPKLQLRLYQFDRLIEELLPVLHVHFLRQGIKSSMFCSQWFLTMFSYRFPLEIVYRIYDNCLASGIEAIFGFSIVLLQKNEEALLSLKFDEILAFLNNKLLDIYKIESSDDDIESKEPKYNVDEFVSDAVSLRITPFMLDSYSHEYIDLVRETNKHALEVDELRTSNRTLSAQVKNLEDNLAQLNVEHVELLNELVKSRLRNEEMEGELVRYKLLYAEAVHKSEDAGSSHRKSSNSMTQMFGLKKG